MLKINHANRNGTGSMLTFAVKNDMAVVLIKRQASTTKGKEFKGGQVALFTADVFELAEMCQVLRGMTESIRDGRGISRGDDGLSLRFRMAHVYEPIPGYAVKIDNDWIRGPSEHEEFVLTCNEALVMMLAVERAIAKIAVD